MLSNWSYNMMCAEEFSINVQWLIESVIIYVFERFVDVYDESGLEQTPDSNQEILSSTPKLMYTSYTSYRKQITFLLSLCLLMLNLILFPETFVCNYILNILY